MLFAVVVDKYVGAGEDTSTHYPCCHAPPIFEVFSAQNRVGSFIEICSCLFILFMFFLKAFITLIFTRYE